MNTLFWGPSGWDFLFSMAYGYEPIKQKKYNEFYTSLKHILPCVYCRNSYTEFLKELPINPYLGSKKELITWLYLLHNKVNDKLRNQGFLTRKNPTFNFVYNKYKKHYKGNHCVDISFWEKPTWIFLNCVAFNYVPEKKIHYARFFKNIGELFPCPSYKQKYNNYIKKHPVDLTDMKTLTKWCVDLCNAIGNKRYCNYDKVCAKYEQYRAGCSKTKGVCRS